MNKVDIAYWLIGLRAGSSWFKIKRLVDQLPYWGMDRIEMYQKLHLRRILIHAYENTFFYKKHFDKCGFDPYQFSDLREIEKIPIIDKEVVQLHKEQFFSNKFKKYYPIFNETGGTTGATFKYYNDTRSWLVGKALRRRTLKMGGYREGIDKLGVLAGGSLLPSGEITLKQRFKRWLFGQVCLSITHMTDESLLVYAEKLKNEKVHFLRGYPSAIYTFAQCLKRNGLKLPMKMVFTTAEMLYPHHRNLFQEIFGCKTIDAYGCADGQAQANECERHNGFHVCPEISYLQIVDEMGCEVGEGVEGDIVVTSLFDYAMPLIRYRPGDMAMKTFRKCNCGRHTPLLQKIIGRSSDLIEFSNGIKLNGLSIPFEEWSDQKVSQFQLVQTAKDTLKLKVVATDRFTKEDEEKAVELLKYHCGEGVKIIFDYVDKFDTSKSGKFRYVISDIKDE